MDWDDLRFVLAVGREGGLARAAKILRINHSTAHRKLAAVERKLGARLFERQRSGYRLTKQGEEICNAAKRMEVEALAIERQILGTDQKLSGNIRLSTSQLVGLYLLPELLRHFVRKFPEVKVEVSISDQFADLGRSETDVVIRGTSSPPPTLVGRRISSIPYCAYAHRSLADLNSLRSLAHYEWVGFASSDEHAPLTRWLHDIAPGVRCRYEFDSAAGVREAVARGLGASVLPCFTADQIPELTRISDVRIEPHFDLWILSHADLRRSARVKAFMGFMYGALTSSPYMESSRLNSRGQAFD